MRVLVDDESTGGLDELATCTRCTHECFRGCDCGRTVQAAVLVSTTGVLAGPVPSGYELVYMLTRLRNYWSRPATATATATATWT